MAFISDTERSVVREHTDDLSRQQALDILIEDLRARGRLGDSLPDENQLALSIIGEYIRFPAPASA